MLTGKHSSDKTFTSASVSSTNKTDISTYLLNKTLCNTIKKHNNMVLLSETQTEFSSLTAMKERNSTKLML